MIFFPFFAQIAFAFAFSDRIFPLDDFVFATNFVAIGKAEFVNVRLGSVNTKKLSSLSIVFLFSRRINILTDIRTLSLTFYSLVYIVLKLEFYSGMLNRL